MSSAGAGSARAQVTRLLALVPYLQQRQDRPLRQVAADFDLDPAQLRRDLRVLWMCGLPGLGPGDLIDINFESFEDDPDGKVCIGNAEYLTRPLRLGSTEAAALTVALRTLRDSGGDAPREVVDRVLDKIERAARDAGPAPVGTEERALPDELAQLRRDVEGAIRADRQVEITYFVPARDESGSRVVDPLSVFGHDGHTYLDAWCHRARGRRTFRLDRVDAVRMLGSARAHPDEPALDLSDGLFTAGPGDTEVQLTVAPAARWLVDHHPVRTVSERSDGGLDVTLDVSDPRWLVRLVLGLAPHVRVVSPPDYADRVLDRARSAAAGYGD